VPCREEIPALDRFYRDNQNDIGFLIVAEWDEESAVEEALGADNKMPVLMDSTEAVRFAYGVEGTPTLVLVDSEGRVAAMRVGTMTAAEMDELLRAL
jgi:thiol-disulfide isomerase/thioredoxin